MTARLKLLVIGCLLSGVASAQICETGTTLKTTPKANFVTVNPDPTRFPVTLAADGSEVLDTTTGLVWQRCSVGQSWDATNETCLGVPSKFFWSEALKHAEAVRNNATPPWRVPNAKEILSIVDFQCMAPPFNLEVFPNTPASVTVIKDNFRVHGSGYWTSSPYLADAPSSSSAYAWYLDSHSGALSKAQASSQALTKDKHFLRLVRSSQ